MSIVPEQSCAWDANKYRKRWISLRAMPLTNFEHSVGVSQSIVSFRCYRFGALRVTSFLVLLQCDIIVTSQKYKKIWTHIINDTASQLHGSCKIARTREDVGSTMGVSEFQKYQAYNTLPCDHEWGGLPKRKLTYAVEHSNNLVSPEVMDENAVADIYVEPDCFNCLDDLLLFSIFRKTRVLYAKGYNYGKPEQIEIQIKVTSAA